MDQNQMDELLNQILEKSKYSQATPEQKNIIKEKLIKKYLNDFNQVAFETFNSEQKTKFSEILATQNQNDIENYIAENTSDIESIAKKAAEKFSQEVYLVLKN